MICRKLIPLLTFGAFLSVGLGGPKICLITKFVN